MTETKQHATTPLQPTLPTSPGRQRKIWADFLRIFSIFLVIMIHEAAQNFYDVPITDSDFYAMNIYDALTHTAVPLFVMISGMLFLDPAKKVPLKTLYGKYILRIAVAMVFWHLLYATYNCAVDDSWDFKSFAENVTDVTHLWFGIMIIGLYMALPFLKKIVESKQLCVYFLILFLVFTSIIPTLFEVAELLEIETIALFKTPFNRLYFNIATQYPGYFILGYLLANYDFKKVQRYLLYGGSVIAAALVAFIDMFISLVSDTRYTYFYGNFSPLIILAAAGTFVFFRYAFSGVQLSPKAEKHLVRLSGDTFGIYLVHILVRNVLEEYGGLSTLSFDPWISIPVLSVLIFVISALISRVLHSIPIVKKYLV